MQDADPTSVGSSADHPASGIAAADQEPEPEPVRVPVSSALFVSAPEQESESDAAAASLELDSDAPALSGVAAASLLSPPQPLQRASSAPPLSTAATKIPQTANARHHHRGQAAAAIDAMGLGAFKKSPYTTLDLTALGAPASLGMPAESQAMATHMAAALGAQRLDNSETLPLPLPPSYPPPPLLHRPPASMAMPPYGAAGMPPSAVLAAAGRVGSPAPRVSSSMASQGGVLPPMTMPLPPKVPPPQLVHALQTPSMSVPALQAPAIQASSTKDGGGGGGGDGGGSGRPLPGNAASHVPTAATSAASAQGAGRGIALTAIPVVRPLSQSEKLQVHQQVAQQQQQVQQVHAQQHTQHAQVQARQALLAPQAQQQAQAKQQSQAQSQSQAQALAQAQHSAEYMQVIRAHRAAAGMVAEVQVALPPPPKQPQPQPK